MKGMDEVLTNIARANGGDCLGLASSDSADLKREKYVWKCEKGHTWIARADSIKRGSWCRICASNKQKKSIDDMRYLASNHNGECLSQVYVNSHTKLTWKCSKGHIFEATPGKVAMGRWCKICGHEHTSLSIRTTMQEIYQLASLRNGKCLSDKYHPPEKLKWQCELGHIWYANLNNVKRGSWCPVCGHTKSGRKRLTIEEMRKLAADHRGQCLSEIYVSSDYKLKWMCENGHIWEALPLSIKKGHWCPVCAGNIILDIEQIQKIAYDRGGKCLSKEYKNNHKKLEWQCAEGHTWFANNSNISLGRWCPECSAGVGERICRAYFEQLFDKKFPKSRPPWLINQDGYQMELDGYCSKLALAFEHQGRQHFQHLDYFYSSEDQFTKRQSDDLRKKALCEQNKIILIEVPQIPDELPLSKVQQYILDKCKSNGIELPDNAESIKIDLRGAFSPTAKEKKQLIDEIAFAQGGSCLSTFYAGNKVKLWFRCEKGHEWETTPVVIYKGHWCPKCSTHKRAVARRLTIDEMRQMAEERGGRCLSTEYINANTHLLWECSKGHQWRAIPNSIKRGSWCAVCAKVRKDRT